MLRALHMKSVQFYSNQYAIMSSRTQIILLSYIQKGIKPFRTWNTFNAVDTSLHSFYFCICDLLAGLHVSKLRFFLLVNFKRFFFCFLLTQAEKRAFSQLKAVISTGSGKKKNRLKKAVIFKTSKPANC